MGPGGRISTVDCSRVLNVNGSLYSSTSRGRAQRVVLRAQRARPVRGPDLNYHRGSCLRLIVSMVVLPEDSTDHYFQFCRMRVSLRSVGTKKTSKNHVSPRGHYCGGLVYLAGTVL